MMWIRVLFTYIHVFILITCPYVSRTKSVSNKNLILMKYNGTKEEAKNLGLKLGLTFKNSVFNDDNHWYQFTSVEFLTQTNVKDIEKEEKRLDKKLKSLTLETPCDIHPKVVTINDPQWSDQWHLQTAQTPGMNVYNAWDKGYTGSGVVIAFLDDGIDQYHTDLAANYDPSYSYDFVNDVSDPSHKYSWIGHGTLCAGVAAAVKNTECVIGTAHEATIGGLKILGGSGATSSEIAMSLTYALSDVDIYSNSWGPSDDGTSFSDISSVEEAAFMKGVSKGRGGLGAIYTWASGNGGENFDDCNADGYAKSIYTITVAAVSETTAPTYYSEHCSAILTATYSGDDPNQNITTTGPFDTCVSNFTGTSSACPLASGVIALTLQANSSLSWRDVQHLIVETSISSGLHTDATFSTNAAGKEFSHYFGFGLMDAEAMVDAAPTWLGVPEYTMCTYPELKVYRSSFHTTISESFTVDNCFIAYTEFVEVGISYSGYFRGDVQFELVSPLGTTSIIFSRRQNDLADHTSSVKWIFMSVHFWGEDPNGDWTLNMIDKSPFADTDLELVSWQMSVYGTITDPLAGTPAAGSLGGTCSSSNDCSSISDGGCLLNGKTCVTCDNNYRIVNTYCVQDGYTDGYCNDSIPCLFSGDQCVNEVCQWNEETEEDDATNNTGLIIGAAVGGIAGVTLLGGGGFLVYKKFIQPKAKGRVRPTSHQITRRNAGGPRPSSTQVRSSQFQSRQIR